MNIHITCRVRPIMDLSNASHQSLLEFGTCNDPDHYSHCRALRTGKQREIYRGLNN